MIFTALSGNKVPLRMVPYKIDWRKPSLSKFQMRIKLFFGKYYAHLDWYEEVPLVGKDVTRLRWDFLCAYNDAFGREQKVFVEVQGAQHEKLILGKFHKTVADFEHQMVKDSIKELFAEKNSKFPIIYFYEDDPELTLVWFEKNYPGFLPRK